VPRHRVGLLALAALSLATSSCSSNGQTPSGVTAAPATGSVVSGATLSQVDARLHELLTSVFSAAGQSPSAHAYVFGGLIPPDSSFSPCHVAGTARHEITGDRIAGVGSPDIGPAVRAALQARGWEFLPWSSGHPTYIRYSLGSQGDFRIKIIYREGMGETDILVGTPCLPGQPITQPSEFPKE
jgi:hypothetical protein